MQHIKVYIIFLSLLACISCKKKETLFSFINSSKTHINFQNTLTSTTDLNILNYLYFYNGSGVSAADFNNDGLTDLYFTANQSEDKLYLNLGDFIFDDITALSGIDNSSNWTTGSTVVDINNDGLLDIYICKLGNYPGIKGQNLLYINQGLKKGIPIFKESAQEYDLNIKSFATQTVFFDYDHDGDLDLYVLTNQKLPNFSTSYRLKIVDGTSPNNDRLYRNNGDATFSNVSKEATILSISLLIVNIRVLASSLSKGSASPE